MTTKPGYTLAEELQFRSNVDTVTWQLIEGWIWCATNPALRYKVEIVVNGTVVAEVVAEMFRSDLLENGIGDGKYGFRLIVSPILFCQPVIHVAIREQSSGYSLLAKEVRLTNPTARLDDAGREFVHAQVSGYEQADDNELYDTLAFLLRQVDRLMTFADRRSETRRSDIETLRSLLPQDGRESMVQRLMDVALSRYGSSPLRLDVEKQPDVSIIIPVHNKFWYTQQCIRRVIEASARRTFEVILVDDLSTDETVLASIVVSGLRVIRNERNLGFVGSVNAGAAIARGKRLLLLNNDTEVQRDWLDELCDTMDRDPLIGVVGSKLIFPNGTLQEVGGIIWRLGDGWNYGRDQDPDRPEYAYLRDVDYVSGAVLLIDRSIWDKVGGLSPDFAPGYYEDTDLCFKVRELGLRVVVQPRSVVVHHEGVTSGTDVASLGMKSYQRTNMRRFARKWAHVLVQHSLNGAVSPEVEAERSVKLHALFIDDSVPTPNQDAGSRAAFEHMQSLMRLGYQVHFVPSDNMARIPPHTDMLERLGVRCYYAPYDMSVEEVLRRQAGRFSLVYFHRLSNAQYITMARTRNPRAAMLYNVADLHGIRLRRQAEFMHDTKLLARAETIYREELAALERADAVIVHSTYEAELLAVALPTLPVTVVSWAIPVNPPSIPFDLRRGLAFIGGDHPPNVDAALWLLEEIMPLVWEQRPDLPLYLIGRHTEDRRLAKLADSRIKVLGVVLDLASVLGTLRLTVAPLRFGAGLKGKMLESFASGLPCVMTPCAAEGANLPPGLAELSAQTAEDLARTILRYHDEPEPNAAAAAAGLAYIDATCSQAVIDGRISKAIQNAVTARHQAAA